MRKIVEHKLVTCTNSPEPITQMLGIYGRAGFTCVGQLPDVRFWIFERERYVEVEDPASLPDKFE